MAKRIEGTTPREDGFRWPGEFEPQARIWMIWPERPDVWRDGGMLTHTFLNVNDYHRYHFPIDGTILELKKIDAFNAVGGRTLFDKESGHYICDCGDTSWQARETRDLVVLDTDYGKVAVLPVGMSQVCSCNFEDHLKVGDKVRKGDPLGYFLFGGSDIVMMFEKGVEFTLLARECEHIFVGEDYADLKMK
ncbi:MAG: phosphatidylserine decarboxylase [Erysipelotrichaceae bacterium]|nr:phosphatidylserine decarboxylase [Erysipelotrichaceae bacterium]